MQSAPVNVSSSGDNTIVAGVAGKTIFVYGYVLISGDTVNAEWKDGASTALTGAMPFVVNSGVSAPMGTRPWFVCSSSTGLVLNLSSAKQVSGHVAYEIL